MSTLQKTDQSLKKRLKKKAFILDTNLFLIRIGFYIVAGIAVYFYFLLCQFNEKYSLQGLYFWMVTVLFGIQFLFFYLTQSSITLLKRRIAQLGDVLEEDEHKKSESETLGVK